MERMDMEGLYLKRKREASKLLRVERERKRMKQKERLEGVLRSHKIRAVISAEKKRYCGHLSLREQVLTNVMQFRAGNPRHEEALREMRSARDDMEEDLAQVSRAINMHSHRACCSCGKDAIKSDWALKDPKETEGRIWVEGLLARKVYASGKAGGEFEGNFLLCKPCDRLLRHGKAGKLAMRKGWSAGEKALK